MTLGEAYKMISFTAMNARWREDKEISALLNEFGTALAKQQRLRQNSHSLLNNHSLVLNEEVVAIINQIQAVFRRHGVHFS
jgi:hypothetical protein